MFLDKPRALFPTHSMHLQGTVIDKKNYPAEGEQNEIPPAPGKFNGIAAEGVVGGWITVTDSATWKLTIRTKSGKTKSVFVDENTYNNTQIGDTYGSAH